MMFANANGDPKASAGTQAFYPVNNTYTEGKNAPLQEKVEHFKKKVQSKVKRRPSDRLVL